MSDPSTPVTGTRDIDWLRSITDTRVTRRVRQPADTQVLHTAHFGIAPETVGDVLTPYTRTDEHFRPEFMTVKWSDGRLSNVNLTGSMRRKNGGVSQKVTRHREYTTGWTREQGAVLDRDKLPAPIRLAIETYERAVAVAATGAAWGEDQ